METLETEFKYAGYIAQQERQVARIRDAARGAFLRIFLILTSPGFQPRCRQKLARVQPADLRPSRRIPGVTPAAIAVLDVYLGLAR